MIPTVNIDEASQDIFGLITALTAAVQTIGNGAIALFLDLVPERGEELWLRFRTFQNGEAPQEVSFIDFIKSVVTTDPIRLQFPKGCALDPTIKALLAGEIQNALNIASAITTNNDAVAVYFADGRQFEIARDISCKGCPQEQCSHFVHPSGKKKRHH